MIKYIPGKGIDGPPINSMVVSAPVTRFEDQPDWVLAEYPNMFALRAKSNHGKRYYNIVSVGSNIPPSPPISSKAEYMEWVFLNKIGIV